MGFISSIWPKKKPDGTYFYSIMGDSFDAFSEYESLKAFIEIPELNTIINWKASAFRNGRIQMVNAEGDVVDDNVKAFRSPNVYQGAGEFLRQTKLFHEVFGNEYLYFLSGLRGFENVKGMFTLPPQHVDITEKTSPFWMNRKNETIYKITWNGKNIHLDTKDIIHLNDNKIDITSTNFVEGTSKIQALKAPLNNIRAAYDARGTNLTEMGARGILSNDSRDGMGATVNLNSSEKDKLHDDYREYGSLKNQKRLIISNLALKWQSMGYSTENLKAFEEVTSDKMTICDQFGVPIDIFSREKGSTYANKIEAEKQAYQDTIIPEANEWIDAINQFFGLEGNKLTMTFDHLPIFQADREKASNAMLRAVNALDKAFISSIITAEEYKDQLNKYMI